MDKQKKQTKPCSPLKKMLEEAKGKWVDELPKVLWAYRTTLRRPTRTTPFVLAYGMEAITPTKIGMPTAKMTVQGQRNENQSLKDIWIGLGNSKQIEKDPILWLRLGLRGIPFANTGQSAPAPPLGSNPAEGPPALSLSVHSLVWHFCTWPLQAPLHLPTSAPQHWSSSFPPLPFSATRSLIRNNLLSDSKITIFPCQFGAQFFTVGHLLGNERPHNLNNLQPLKKRNALPA
ncbi:hypothetical protein CK203_102339 [Vitis vinifera]|uniref:Uncharacterized protein n=1 Tax=Vitis vinifera TaxID=29760 RepID=A0A438BR10_VITVI|nr:hypothetical protein CK203_102339 [Vitis vinifera]